VSGREAVRVRVATSAKPNTDKSSSLDKEFFNSFLEVINLFFSMYPITHGVGIKLSVLNSDEKESFLPGSKSA
jgi:hypothetical protein